MIFLSKRRVVTIGAATLAVLFLFSFLAAGEEVAGKLTEVIRDRLGIHPDVYQVIETEYQGEKVILIAIYGSDKALDSSLGSDLKSGLRENMDESPIALSILTKDRDVKFHPYSIRIVQGGEKKRAKNLIGITDGFEDGAMPEEVPIEGENFWGSKGIITLGDDFDETTPFSVEYGSSSADFSLPEEATEATEPKEVEKEEPEERPEVGDSESGLKANEPEGENDREPSEETSPESRSGSAVGNSRTGEGLALLTQLATLLSFTLFLL